jgi:hypothetical protein
VNRDLTNRDYDRMTHDEILQEHGRRYQAMSPRERLKQSKQRDARYLGRSKTESAKLKWSATKTVAVGAFIVFAVFWFFTGSPPGVVAVIIGASCMLGTLAMEATEEVCARLDRRADDEVMTGLSRAE